MVRGVQGGLSLPGGGFRGGEPRGRVRGPVACGGARGNPWEPRGAGDAFPRRRAAVRWWDPRWRGGAPWVPGVRGVPPRVGVACPVGGLGPVGGCAGASLHSTSSLPLCGRDVPARSCRITGAPTVACSRSRPPPAGGCPASPGGEWGPTSGWVCRVVVVLLVLLASLVSRLRIRLLTVVMSRLVCLVRLPLPHSTCTLPLRDRSARVPLASCRTLGMPRPGHRGLSAHRWSRVLVLGGDGCPCAYWWGSGVSSWVRCTSGRVMFPQGVGGYPVGEGAPSTRTLTHPTRLASHGHPRNAPPRAPQESQEHPEHLAAPREHDPVIHLTNPMRNLRNSAILRTHDRTISRQPPSRQLPARGGSKAPAPSHHRTAPSLTNSAIGGRNSRTQPPRANHLHGRSIPR